MKLASFATSLRQILCSWSLPACSEAILMVRMNEAQEGQATGQPGLQRARGRSWALWSSLPPPRLNPSEILYFPGCEMFNKQMTYVTFLLFLLYIKADKSSAFKNKFLVETWF